MGTDHARDQFSIEDRAIIKFKYSNFINITGKTMIGS